jgi:CBS domain containing-hemolysin-like protein
MKLAPWLVFSICLLLSFLFSGMEAGVFALSRLRIRQQMRAGRRSAHLLHSYLENAENFLWTILVGNTLANFFIFGWMIFALHGVLKFQRAWFVLIFSSLVFLFYVFFDLLPKMLFRRFPNRLCISLARPFRFLHLALQPLVAVVEMLSNFLLRIRGGKTFQGHLFGNREELRLIMQDQGQGLSSEERNMINRVLDLQSTTVRQAMRPLPETATVRASSSVADVLAIFQEKKFTRLPVWEKVAGKDRISGLISVDRLLFESPRDSTNTVGGLVQPALFLEEDLRLEVALRRMQRSGQRMAIVLGRDKRENGIITFQDVLRITFGEVSL